MSVLELSLFEVSPGFRDTVAALVPSTETDHDTPPSTTYKRYKHSFNLEFMHE